MTVATNIIDYWLKFRFGRALHRQQAGGLHDFVHLDFLNNPYLNLFYEYAALLGEGLECQKETTLHFFAAVKPWLPG